MFVATFLCVVPRPADFYQPCYLASLTLNPGSDIDGKADKGGNFLIPSLPVTWLGVDESCGRRSSAGEHDGLAWTTQWIKEVTWVGE